MESKKSIKHLPLLDYGHLRDGLQENRVDYLHFSLIIAQKSSF